MTLKGGIDFRFLGGIVGTYAIPEEAVVVLIERDPRDVALSNFLQTFATFQPWSTNLVDAAGYVSASQRLIHHWTGSLGIAVITVQYDDLVNKPRQTIEALLADVGLDASDASVAGCLDFWRPGQHRTGNTASARQVCQSSCSSCTWMKTASFFPSFLTSLPTSRCKAQFRIIRLVAMNNSETF